jgi:hypothetical protein
MRKFMTTKGRDGSEIKLAATLSTKIDGSFAVFNFAFRRENPESPWDICETSSAHANAETHISQFISPAVLAGFNLTVIDAARQRAK